jgi:hypothetical protein
MSAPPSPPPRPSGAPRGTHLALRYGSWRGMSESGLTWRQLHELGLTWEELIWVEVPDAPPIVAPTRVSLNGARRSGVLPAAPPSRVALGAGRGSRVQTEPPGGGQHGRP